MYCNNCEAGIEEKANFCANCGTPVEKPATPGGHGGQKVSEKVSGHVDNY